MTQSLSKLPIDRPKPQPTPVAAPMPRPMCTLHLQYNRPKTLEKANEWGEGGRGQRWPVSGVASNTLLALPRIRRLQRNLGVDDKPLRLLVA